MTMTETKKIFARTRIIVPEGERALVLVNGKFDAILRPGRHTMPFLFSSVKVEAFQLVNAAFASPYEQALVASRPDLVAEHFTDVRTSADEVGVIYRDGKLHSVQKPDARHLLWTDSGPWKVELIDVSKSLDVPAKLAQRLGVIDRVKRFSVEDGQKGLLYIDGAFIRLIDAGAHAFWNVGRAVSVKIVDTRQHALDVTGQEVLTRDKVSLRVNLVAKYTVVDVVKAVSSVKDFADALYRALQHAFRQSLSAKSLDEILSRKGEVDLEAAKQVRDEMALIGLEVGDISIKDVILPGDMRDMLNKVVNAEKEAEANVIRRREETNATRSLLNTAKIMAENPVMLRLKELEALEKIADKVQTLTVHNGTQGLMNDLVSLRAPAAQAARKRVSAT
jgi:regulator of protease activity HflC (stomatin/prohibitin superfamily)